MTTNNIFGNDILSGDLNTSLAPELGQDDISLNITPQNSSFIDPLTQELSLIEPEIILDENDNSNNKPSSNNSQLVNNISLANTDPLTGDEVEENQIDVNDTSFAPPQSELQFQGGFGDYDGGDDVTLEIEDDEGTVVETFKLTGEGQATLYRDQEYQYVFFSGVDETTNVDIDSVSNIKFGNYIGDSLEIETTGSIEGGDIVLNDPDETGLVLKSGVENLNEGNLGYSITELGSFSTSTPRFIDRKTIDINNLGQITGNGRNGDALIYSDGEVTNLGSLDLHGDAPLYTRPTGINDLGQVVGYSGYRGQGNRGFVYSDGEIKFLSPFGVNTDNEALDINNSGQIAGYAEYREVINDRVHNDPRAFIIDEGNLTVLPVLQRNNNNGRATNYATSINDVGQIAGRSGTNFNEPGNYPFVPVLYSNGGVIDLGNFGYRYLPSGNAKEINNLGYVVGHTTNDRGTKTAFLDDGEDLINLGFLPGHIVSVANDINDSGQVIGSSGNSSGGSGFIYQGGQIYDLNDLIPEDSEWEIQDPHAINNKGQIVGFGKRGNLERAFLLDPIVSASNSEIKVGNITTFGDTVLLQGNEITLTGKSITTNGGEITFDGTTTTERNLTIGTSVIEDEEVTDGGDITFTGTLDSANAGSNSLRLQAGTDNILFSDVVGGEATLNNINIQGAKTVTAEADLTSNGLIKINATEDITAKNITSETGNIRLTSEEKSITAEDITTSNPEGKNIVIEAIEGVDVGNLDAGESGKVNIKSGEVLDKDTKTTEDDTVIVGDVITGDITGKQVSVFSTGSFDAIGDIKAHNGKVEITAIDDINTRGINSLTKSIRLISTEGAVTVDGDLNSEKNGIAIHAKDDITTKRIRSFNGVIGLSSYAGSVIVEDDINTVKGGVVIAGFEDVQVGNINTGIGEVNIGSGGDIDVNGTITTNVGYVSIVTNENIDAQSITTSKGFVEVVAGEIATANIATGNGVSTLVSVANLDDEVLVATNPGTDLSSSIDKPEDLSEEQKETLGEFVEDLWYRTPRLGKFITGALYQWGLDNGEEIRFFLPKSLKLSKKEDALLDAILNQSDAFELGRLAGSGASIAQGILEFIAGSGISGGGGGLCITGIGCFAGAPAIATGVALQVHGAKLAVTSADDFGNRLSDILSPNRMASSSADDIDALGKETGIDPTIIKKVYGDLGRNGDGIRLLDEKLGTDLTENLFNKGGDGGTGSQLVKDVADLISRFTNKPVGNKLVDDADAIADIKENLSFNQINKRGKQFLDDTQLKKAFTNTTEFVSRYGDRVSGAIANRFGKAAARGNTAGLLNPQKLDFTQAAGEIKTAEDILDGVTPLGNNVQMRGLTEIGGQTNPDWLAILPDANTRLVEVKTLEGSFTKNKINARFRKATEQIIGRVGAENIPVPDKPTKNGYIRLDFRNADATGDTRDFLFEAVEDLLNNKYTKKIEGNKINTEVTKFGYEVVEFVELIYKDKTNQVRSILAQFKNGVFTRLN